MGCSGFVIKCVQLMIDEPIDNVEIKKQKKDLNNEWESTLFLKILLIINLYKIIIPKNNIIFFFIIKYK